MTSSLPLQDGSANATPPLVLLHGFCLGPTTFQPILPHLPPDWQVYMPAIPGHADQPWRSGMKSLRDFSAYFLRWMDAEGIDKAFWAGHSLGGYLAVDLARRHPDRVAGLGLLHSSPLADTPERKLNRDKSYDFILHQGRNAFFRSFVPLLTSDEGLREELYRICHHTKERAMLDLTLAMRDRRDDGRWIANWKKPLLVLVGSEDQVVSHGAWERPPQTLECKMEGASHMGMMEEPARTAQLLTAWGYQAASSES